MNEWIRVKDRFPENLEYVLATDKNDIYIFKFNISQDKRLKKPTFYFEDSSFENDFDSITHWMPLPNLPKD